MDTDQSAEMYLLTTALMQSGPGFVPLRHLADELGFSQVSVNQMCRKLQDRGLLRYVPYRGVTLTAAGRRKADAVIRKRRLWEVFLVEELGLSLSEAEDAACKLEHVTTEATAARLSAFLGHPETCPHGDPIPADGGAARIDIAEGGAQ